MTGPTIIAKGLEVSKHTMDAIRSVTNEFAKAGIQTITIKNNVESRLGGGDLIHFDMNEIAGLDKDQYAHFQKAKKTLVDALDKVGAAPVDLDPKQKFDDSNIAIARNSAWKR